LPGTVKIGQGGFRSLRAGAPRGYCFVAALPVMTASGLLRTHIRKRRAITTGKRYPVPAFLAAALPSFFFAGLTAAFAASSAAWRIALA